MAVGIGLAGAVEPLRAIIAEPELGRVEARMLFEVYDDQVNIVQLSDGSRRQTLLFSKGDGAKEVR